MKIQITYYKETVTFETDHDDLSLDDLHNIWERCLLAMTWHQKTIDEFYNME